MNWSKVSVIKGPGGYLALRVTKGGSSAITELSFSQARKWASSCCHLTADQHQQFLNNLPVNSRELLWWLFVPPGFSHHVGCMDLSDVSHQHSHGVCKCKPVFTLSLQAKCSIFSKAKGEKNTPLFNSFNRAYLDLQVTREKLEMLVKW